MHLRLPLDPAGEVRLLSSGASPISAEVFDFMRICFGATGTLERFWLQTVQQRSPDISTFSQPAVMLTAAVLEGYGMTETSCLIALTPPGDPVTGHVGPPSPACEVSADG